MWALLAKPRRRLDLAMVELGLASTRSAAQGLIDSCQVLVNGSIATKSATKVASSDQVTLAGPKPRYVARSGFKLERAIELGWIEPAGLNCLDAGSSTGGFTDCLLQHGASRVSAVDVGTNQLHEKLRKHPQVSVHEQTDIRSFDCDLLFDLVVADLSFISILKVAEKLVSLANQGADLVLLVKPQFEAGRQVVSKGNGVVKDPSVWLQVLRSTVVEFLKLPVELCDIAPSPIKGANGNVEFLLWFKTIGTLEARS